LFAYSDSYACCLYTEGISIHEISSLASSLHLKRYDFIKSYHVLIKPHTIPRGKLLETPGEQVEIIQEEPFIQRLTEESGATGAASTSIIATVKSDIANAGKVGHRITE
jgi:hypothetical protein